jgi:hypothetical protein
MDDWRIDLLTERSATPGTGGRGGAPRVSFGIDCRSAGEPNLRVSPTARSVVVRTSLLLGDCERHRALVLVQNVELETFDGPVAI